MNPVPGGLFQRKDHRVAHVHTTWLTGTATEASTDKGRGVITVRLPDGISIGAVEGEHAESLGQGLVELGHQVLLLNDTTRHVQDDLAVRLFMEQEDLVPELLPTLRRFVGFLDGVRTNALDEVVVAELVEALQ